MFRGHVFLSVFLRNVSSYFSGILGYLIVIAFVVAGSFFAFSPEFFANNQATLDQLTQYYPWLLVLVIPAITMGLWAEERKTGTDELLFTLPSIDLEILLGKYFAAVGIYAIAVLFSMSHVFVLTTIGDPDTGILFTTYLGYLLAGSALIAAGMFASSLTSNTTVAFVLGALFCAIPVFISNVMGLFLSTVSTALAVIGASGAAETIDPIGRVLEGFTIGDQLSDFALGIIPLSGVLYFASLAVLFLYLNLVVISKRHWAARGAEDEMTFQFILRGISLTIVIVCCNTMLYGSSFRTDCTRQGILSLSSVSKTTIQDIDSQRPITIQAFVSNEVPDQYIGVKKQLVGILRQFNGMGGNRLNVRLVAVDPLSKAEEEAQGLGLNARTVQSQKGGILRTDDIFLGAHISSGYDEVLVPFFDLGVSAEYELTRAIEVVSRKERLTVGVLATDAKINGGMNMQTFRQQPEWRIVTELKKQYNIVEVSPDQPIDRTGFDVLLAVMPSSLTQPQMENLLEYVRTGGASLIFDDPFPQAAIQLAPSLPKPSQGGGMMGRQQPSEPKADNGQLTSLLNLLQISWRHDQVLFDKENSHPHLSEVLTPEIVFVSPKVGVSEAFSKNSEITRGLQELVVMYTGTIQKRKGMTLNYLELLRSGASNSGLLMFSDLVQQTILGQMMNPNPKRVTDDYAHVLAAQITGEAKTGNTINTIFVADVDIISDPMFALSEQTVMDLKFDNIVFTMNCVDKLAGEEDFITLRKKRAKERTLELVEARTVEYVKTRETLIEEAQKDADRALEEAREELQKRQTEVENDTSLDAQSKQRILRNLEEAESRRLEVKEAEINRELQQTNKQIEREAEMSIRDVKSRIRFLSILGPPLPALILGILVYFWRAKREQAHTVEERRRSKTTASDH